jgi:hypothetical protein
MALQAIEESTTVSTIADALQRGDVTGALGAVGLPRRGFLAGLAALVPVATTASTAAAVLPDDDAEMVRLSQQISELRMQEKAAFAECLRCHKVCEQIEPVKSRILLWSAGDPVGPTTFDPIVLANGSRLVWCDPHQIAKIAQGELPTELFDGPQRDRAVELVNAWEEWRNGIDEARRRSGYTAADEARNAISEEISDLYHQMIELRATTLEGIRAMAMAVVEACWCGEIDMGVTTADMHGLAVIVSSLTGVPIEEAA